MKYFFLIFVSIKKSKYTTLLLNENEILINELKKGNEKAYQQLYNMYYKNLVIYCFGMTHRLALAEDIVQNTFVKIWENRKGISINSSLKSYLYRAVFNAFSSEYNRKKCENKILVQLKYETLNKVVGYDEELLTEKLRLLDKAIEKLPKKCKTVFLLNKKQGYSYKEIAIHLNITEKAVEKHISRAICRIRILLNHKTNIICYLVWLFRYNKRV